MKGVRPVFVVESMFFLVNLLFSIQIIKKKNETMKYLLLNIGGIFLGLIKNAIEMEDINLLFFWFFFSV